MDRVYVGLRAFSRPRVLVISKGSVQYLILPSSSLLQGYSAGGFEWGYSGQGPSKLALALVADVTGSDQVALDNYEQVALTLVQSLPTAGWLLREFQVWSHVKTLIV